jgi:hypothetical protein
MSHQAIGIRRVILSVALTVALGAGFWFVLQRVAPQWGSWRQASCWPDHCFCEEVREGPIRQPVNALSSFAFVVVAVLIATKPRAEESVAESAVPPAMRRVFVVALVVVGFGSALFHASLTFVGQSLDVLGMFLVASAALVTELAARSRLVRHHYLITYEMSVVPLSLLLWFLPGTRRYLFAAVLLMVLALNLTRGTEAPEARRRLLQAAGIVGVAFAVWILDITRCACDPTGVLQGHAVWHLLGATATCVLYRGLGSIWSGLREAS